MSETEEVDWKRKEVRERLGSVGIWMGCLGEECVIVLRSKQFFAIVKFVTVDVDDENWCM